MPDLLLIGLVVVAAVVGFVAVKSLVLWRLVRSGALDRAAAADDRGGRGSLIVFAFLWTTVVGVADAQIGRNAFRQARTAGFAVADGEVRSCRVVAEPDDEGTSYDVEMEYVYRVGDRAFTGTRVRHAPLWGHAAATEYVADHPPGSPVPVYYDPDEPAEAVLLPGPGGRELFLALFLTPFNVILVGCWVALARAQATGPPDPVDSPTSRAGEDRLRLPPASPAQAAAGVLLAGSFLGTFAVAFCAGMPPSTALMAGVWAIVLSAAGTSYGRLAARVRSGRYDLVVDRDRRTLTLPVGFGRKQPVTIPLADLREVRVVAGDRTDGDGGKNRVFVPTVVWRDGDAVVEARLAEWPDRDRAERLADWLRAATGPLTSG